MDSRIRHAHSAAEVARLSAIPPLPPISPPRPPVTAAFENVDAADLVAVEKAGGGVELPVRLTTVKVHGILSDGRRYAYALPQLHHSRPSAEESANADSLVGKVLEGGWLVRAPLEPRAISDGGRGGAEYLLTLGKGYSFINLSVSESTLRRWLKSDDEGER
mmetsp:Transcript_20910/g.53052  ORF Transcript_20910/g.53052 Transcript_20910/m.53052 type:complete len:162 (-) Transcript_20910:211-696(-)